MKLAIVHYHLNRGGVTRVVANHLLSLEAARAADPSSAQTPLEVAVLFGGRREGWNDALAGQLGNLRLRLVVIPALEYDDDHHAGVAVDPQHLGAQIKTALDEIGFQPGDTVLHFHNHALGKNVAVPATVAGLAAQGYGVLLQIHDFAEDMRPKNYARLAAALGPDDGQPAASLYPQASQIHYAVLNGRDRRVLAAAGTAPARLHLLPNPVDRHAAQPPREAAREKLHDRFGVSPDRHLLVYPVRGIRRKNIGEALLYAALAPPHTVVGITLAPLNPAEVPRYTAWKEAAARLELPVVFELGGPGGLGFGETLAAADAILSTSIAEGFGMAFLESWLVGRPLIGRDLPGITEDFVNSGVELPWSHDRLNVPADWIDRDRFTDQMVRAFAGLTASYSGAAAELAESAVVREKFQPAADPSIAAETVDFGQLDSSLQREVLEKVAAQPAASHAVVRLNPWLDDALRVDAARAAAVIEKNVRAIEQHYSFAASGRRLLGLLDQVAGSPRERSVGRLPAAGRILEEFLNLRHFRLLLA
jgi:glycosyltransferase involved in cell wall biosynthesis